MITTEAPPCAVCGSDRRVGAKVRAPRDDYAIEVGLPEGRSRWVVCEDCGLVYQSPRPGQDAVADLYTGGTYHEQRGGVPDHYVQYSRRRSAAAFEWAFSQPALRPLGGRAVDVGCGIGGALLGLRERGFEVVGVEPDPELSEYGRREFGLEVVTGYFDGDTFGPGADFDFAYSCHVWEHLADPLATTKAVHAALVAKQGYFLIVVPTFRRARTLAWSCFTAPHTYMWTDVSLGNLLHQAGFDVVAHRYAAAADSELWMLARARPGDDGERLRREDPARVQRELALVPLRAPLGLPKRALAHVQTLRRDPADFAARLARWAKFQLTRARRAMTRST